MAALAAHRCGLQVDAFTGGEIRMEICGQRCHRLRWRLQHVAEHVACEKNATVDGGGVVGVGPQTEKIGMGQHSGPLAVIKCDRTVGSGVGDVDAVKRPQRSIEKHLRGGEQAAEVARSATGGVGEQMIELEMKARSHARRDPWRELGKL